MGANVYLCSSWDGNGNWVRNIAAISLSSNPTYTFDVYLGCDYARQASLAPSGNWYIASFASSQTQDYNFNTIIQKVHRIQPSLSQWVGLPENTFIPFSELDLNEYQNCTLRVPGLSFSVYEKMNVFAFDCKQFNQIAAYGSAEPQIRNAKTVKWIGQNAYIVFRDVSALSKF